jgi:ribosomal protein S18 acetylase RimI-like enzyme
MKIRYSKEYNYEFEELYSLVKKLDSLFVPPLSERVDLQEYVKKIDNKGSLELAYSNEEKLIGTIAYYNNDLINRFAYITYLGVLPEFQGNGIAKRLIKRCIKHCEENGMEQVGIETWEKNTPVIQLYKKFDFELKNIKSDRKNINSVKLIKEL